MLTRLVVALVLGGGCLVLGGPAQADACPDSSGVTVVVDFGSRRVSQVTGCSFEDPATGLEALANAGFDVPYYPREPGFVCQIQGYPADRDCMEPNYWAYWHKSGSGWDYSTSGAGSYDPAPGTTEGWSFTGGRVPPNGPEGNGVQGSPSPVTKSSGQRPDRQPDPRTGSSTTREPRTPARSQARASTPPSAATGLVSVPTSNGATRTMRVSRTEAAKIRKAKRAGHVKQARRLAASASASPTPQAHSTARAVYTPPKAAAEPGDDGSLPWWWGLVAVGLLGSTAAGVAVARRRGA